MYGKKKEVAVIRMYIAQPISNLAISDQGNSLNWKWFKVDKGGTHSICKIMQLYDWWTCLSFLVVTLSYQRMQRKIILEFKLWLGKLFFWWYSKGWAH